MIATIFELGFIVATFLVVGCDGSASCGKATDAGVLHDETVLVAPSDTNGSSFDACAAGDCESLCDLLRGHPGNGTRVSITGCELQAIGGTDASSDAPPAGPDGSVPDGSQEGGKDSGLDLRDRPASLSLRIVYVVYDLGPGC